MDYSGKSDIVDVNVTVHMETPKAWLMQNKKNEKVWLPKSMVEMETTFNGYIPQSGIITLPEWLAIKKDLI